MPKKRKKKRKKSAGSQSKPKASKKPSTSGSSSRKEVRRSFLKEQREAYAQGMSEAETELGLRATLGWKILLFIPLVAGSVIAKSSIQIELTPFYLLFACMLLSSGLALHKRVSSAWSIPAAAIYLALLLTILVFYKSFNMEAALIIVPVICALMAYVELKNIESISDLVTVSLALPLLLTTIAGTAFYAQSGKLFWTVGIVGLVPGLMGVAALIIDNKELLVQAGWRVSREVVRKGKTRQVPAGIAIVVSSFLLLPPILLLLGMPLGKVPPTFIVLFLAFYFLPGIMQSFLEQSTPDLTLAIKASHQAVLTSLLITVGFIALNMQ